MKQKNLIHHTDIFKMSFATIISIFSHLLISVWFFCLNYKILNILQIKQIKNLNFLLTFCKCKFGLHFNVLITDIETICMFIFMYYPHINYVNDKLINIYNSHTGNMIAYQKLFIFCI